MIHGSPAFRKVSWNSDSWALGKVLPFGSPLGGRFTGERFACAMLAASGDRMLSTNWSRPTRPWLSMPLWCLGPADWGKNDKHWWILDPSLVRVFRVFEPYIYWFSMVYQAFFGYEFQEYPPIVIGVKWQTSRSDSELTSTYAESREREMENKMVRCWMYKRTRPWWKYVLHKIHLILHSLCQTWNPTIAISRVVRESSHMTPNFWDYTLNWLGYMWHVSVESCMPVLGMIKPPKMAWFSNYQFLSVPCNVGA